MVVEIPFADILGVFMEVINDEPVPVSGADGRVPVVMAMAAKKSYDENRPVKLSEVS